MTAPVLSRAAFLVALAAVLIGATGRAGFSIGAPGALAIGMALALVGLAAFHRAARDWSRRLIQISIVLLGFSIPLADVARAGFSGVGLTLGTIGLALAGGLLLARLLRVEPYTATLLTSGTAICGGSAIAATGAAIAAPAAAVSLATAVVFLLNACGVYAYPPLGRWLGLSQEQFGAWAAIGIHDTAGVVAAATEYGSSALAHATIIKLTRVLWIVPVAMVLAGLRRRSARCAAAGPGSASPRRSSLAAVVPWFIAGFIAACTLRSLLPALGEPRSWLPAQASVALAMASMGKHLLTLALFLVGSGLSRTALAAAGWRPLVMGTLLWLLLSGASLVAVRALVH